MANIDELLREHVTLEVECVDRLYLNGYIARLQTGGHLAGFMVNHLGKAIPSPALLGPIARRFASSVKAYARERAIPWVPFKARDRKDSIANALRRTRPVRDDVVFVGVAQEKAIAFQAHKRDKKKGWVGFEFTRDKPVYVNYYYFCIDDADYGPAFMKMCSYAPWGMKVCLNGHEWAKRQLAARGIGFEALDNGFLSCEDPEALQGICDELGPRQIMEFYGKWLERLPLPLDEDVFAKLRPGKKRQAQIDRGGIERVHRAVQFQSKIVARIKVSGCANQYLRQVGPDAPVASFVGVRQRASGNTGSKARMVEFGVHGVQTDFDIAKAVAVRQLRERHRKELIEAPERVHAMIAAITLDALVELVPGEEIQQL